MEHATHDRRDHTHGDGCGHTAIRHDDHVDYVHDGHLHDVHGDYVDEHSLASETSGAACGSHVCDADAPDHHHDAVCGHEAVPHGDHADYLVDAHIHHQHREHCDDHGRTPLA